MSNFEEGEFDESCDLGHWGCTNPEHYNKPLEPEVAEEIEED